MNKGIQELLKKTSEREEVIILYFMFYYFLYKVYQMIIHFSIEKVILTILSFFLFYIFLSNVKYKYDLLDKKKASNLFLGSYHNV